MYHAGAVSHLILCGGLGQHPPSEAEAMWALLRAAGVPKDAMTREAKSTTTGENIRNAKALLEGPHVMIITDWYHAPRARLIARRQGLIPLSASPQLTGAKVWPQAKAALREIPAYLVYALGLKS